MPPPRYPTEDSVCDPILNATTLNEIMEMTTSGSGSGRVFFLCCEYVVTNCVEFLFQLDHHFQFNGLLPGRFSQTSVLVKGDSVKCTKEDGVERTLLSKYFPVERNVLGSVKQKFIKLSCCATRTSWDSSLLIIKVGWRFFFVVFVNMGTAENGMELNILVSRFRYRQNFLQG